jgi:hypothetical protein
MALVGSGLYDFFTLPQAAAFTASDVLIYSRSSFKSVIQLIIGTYRPI